MFHWVKTYRLSAYWDFIVRPHLRLFLLLFFLSVLTAFFGMATLGLGVPLIDAVMQEGVASGSKTVVFLVGLFQWLGLPAAKDHLVLGLFLCICVVAVIHNGFSFLQQYWSSWVSQKVRAGIKIRLFERILGAGLPYLETKSRGSLLYDINRPSEAVYRIVDFFGRLINPLMHIVLYFGLMFYLSWKVAAVTGLVILAVLTLGFHWIGMSFSELIVFVLTMQRMSPAFGAFSSMNVQMTLPEGYDTVIGDRGLRLSGGQAQRVAIAREILKKPRIFIFDEATSALDNLTEKAVYDAMMTLRKKAIVIVVAHRLSTVRDADQIVVLESGKINATGTHESLINAEGLYRELHSVHSQAGPLPPIGPA